MATIYRLRMLSDENDAFVREYEIGGEKTLADLNELINTDLGYDADAAGSFFASDAQWEKLLEFTPFDMGDDGPVPMDRVELGQVLELPQARLIYVFDMLNERALYLESAGSFEAKGGFAYPRVSLSEGPAPDQYEPEENTSTGSIFDEALGEFGSFEGDDQYDDE